MLKWTKKHLLGLEQLTQEEIELILHSAQAFREVSERKVKKVPALRGKSIVNLFFEPSTRTRTSFELAAKRLSADVINFSASASSLVKGESILDTLKNLEAYSIDVFVVRHSISQTALYLSQKTHSSVINAGDGQNEHPTQALLDMFTVSQKMKSLKNLKVAIIGDIAHSRVARSNIWGFSKCGAQVVVCGPAPLIPKYFESLPCTVTHSLKEAVADVQVVIMLRVQKERDACAGFSSYREYIKYFSLNEENSKFVPPQALILHPGPVNWDIEIASALKSKVAPLILEQVTNGLAIRMAVLYLIASGEKYEVTA